MGFVKTFQEIAKNRKETFDFYGAEMLAVFWETKREIIAGLLPEPLKPAEKPYAMAFIADYPSTNFTEPYRESALFIRALFNGEEGNYCLSMPVTDDMALIGGREYFGFPKKIGSVSITKNGETAGGWTERHGIRFMEIKAKLTGVLNDPGSMGSIMNLYNQRDGALGAVTYNFKFFPAPERNGFDYNPRLVKQETLFRAKKFEYGEAEILFNHSDYDPWHEVEVVRMLGAFYTVGDNSMLPGSVIAETDPMKFAPYAYYKSDVK